MALAIRKVAYPWFRLSQLILILILRLNNVWQDPLQLKVFFYDFKYLKHLRLEQLCNYESMHHSFPSAY